MNMDKESLRQYCLYQHLAEFVRQCIDHEAADWSKPCESCKMLQSNRCNCDWYGNVAYAKPSDIRFNLCKLEAVCK